MLEKIGNAIAFVFLTVAVTGLLYCVFIGLLQGTIGNIVLWRYALGLAALTTVPFMIWMAIHEKKTGECIPMQGPRKGLESFLELKPLQTVAWILATMLVLGCFSLGFETLSSSPKLGNSLFLHALTWSIYAVLQFVVFPRWSRKRRLNEESNRMLEQSNGATNSEVNAV